MNLYSASNILFYQLGGGPSVLSHKLTRPHIVDAWDDLHCISESKIISNYFSYLLQIQK